MKRILVMMLGVALAVGLAWATPEDDRLAFIEYHKKKFPDVAVEDYINGVYAINAPAYQQWLQIEEFPPYELAMAVRLAFPDVGRQADGRRLSPRRPMGVRLDLPAWGRMVRKRLACVRYRWQLPSGERGRRRRY